MWKVGDNMRGMEVKEITTDGGNNTSDRVRSLEYESTAMNNFMRSVKHRTHVLIVSAHYVDWRCKFAHSDVMKNFRFRSNFGHETFQGSHGSRSCS